MTVYKSVKLLAETAAEVAMLMIEDKEIPSIDATVHNGAIEVPSILLSAIK